MKLEEENMRMFNIIVIILLVLAMILLSGCKTKTVYVPVESVKTEYSDKLVKDSVYILDSVFVYSKNDTVFLNKLRVEYKDRLMLDSIYITDSIAVPYKIVEYKEVNRLTEWQNFQVWCGRIILSLIAIYLAYKFILNKSN